MAFIRLSKGIMTPLVGYKPCCRVRTEMEQGFGEHQYLRDQWTKNPEGKSEK